MNTYTNNVRNPRTCATHVLLSEALRLDVLLERLGGVRMMKGNRARAQKSLRCIKRELSTRKVEVME